MSDARQPAPDHELADLTARDLLRHYARRTLSPVEVMQAVIARAERAEPVLKALYAFEPERALEEARASETRWMRGGALVLDGVPATLKENIATCGTPMPLGTAARLLDPMPEDAPPAARLREAGAVVFAKTTMPDYGMLSSGLSSFHPLTRNPWDTTKTPGGSSSGAGAAAAAGYGPLHVGTDIGGSIRLPAGWCGVFGLKPSLGRIPIEPSTYGRVAGPMTRTVADAALMMGVLSRPDPRDAMSLPAQDIVWDDLAEISLKGLRLGLMLDAGVGLPLDPEVRVAVEEAARLFEGVGAIVEPMPAFLNRAMLDGLDGFWRMRAWMDLRLLLPEARERVLPYIRTWAESGRDLSGEAVYDGFNQMSVMRNAAVTACRPFDFVLSPVSPVPAFPAELASPVNDPMRPFEHIGYTVAFNMSEQPAASVDCGCTRGGLPIGLQIVGQRFDDLGVLRLSHAFETLRPRQRPWPAF